MTTAQYIQVSAIESNTVHKALFYTNKIGVHMSAHNSKSPASDKRTLHEALCLTDERPYKKLSTRVTIIP
ncbi:hypothetical protein DPMN_083101 [Dreissena polymorpha]|uniref:Uncharacterized protein n=1 Tax=Dreissena polymorpha TaxID=45954 RepID=A0A9D3Y869_DREPO|nr:hypothetical protein DPMN_083101 [Dreissena polymorpha]